MRPPFTYLKGSGGPQLIEGRGRGTKARRHLHALQGWLCPRQSSQQSLQGRQLLGLEGETCRLRLVFPGRPAAETSPAVASPRPLLIHPLRLPQLLLVLVLVLMMMHGRIP